MRLRRHVGGGHPRDGRIRASHGEVPRAGQPGGMHGDQRGVGEDEADDRGPRVGAGGAPLCGEWRRRCHVEHGGVVALLQVAAQRRLKDDDGRPSAPLGLVHDAVARKHAVLAPDAIGGAVGQAGRSRKHADAVSWNQYAVVVTRRAKARIEGALAAGVVVAAAAGPAGEDLAPAFERAKPRYLTRRLKTLVHGAGAFPIMCT
mmetsp:Transcript_8233/g.24311  ORF Transcript_8233/g.24311 Transcript_8233/m.24311 type:complete len:203 (+) Transcript_8233:827-1435(+)